MPNSLKVLIPLPPFHFIYTLGPGAPHAVARPPRIRQHQEPALLVARLGAEADALLPDHDLARGVVAVQAAVRLRPPRAIARRLRQRAERRAQAPVAGLRQVVAPPAEAAVEPVRVARGRLDGREQLQVEP